jgi:hypothetical protein
MKIYEFYYDDMEQDMVILFNINADSYLHRRINLSLDELMYYSPVILEEEDIVDCDEDIVLDILNEYLKENDLPEEELF